jgi:hypothetical protein
MACEGCAKRKDALVKAVKSISTVFLGRKPNKKG